MNNRLLEFLDSNNLIKPNLIDFRKGYRTSDHVFVLKNLIDIYTQLKIKIYACFVDFRKAYDMVWRNGLFFKLIKLGISKTFVMLMIDMYSKVSSSVKLHSGLSPPFESSVGVSNLGPTVFDIFVNDIPEIFDSNGEPVQLKDCSLNCLLYADDLILLSESKIGLQSCINNLKMYTERWKMSINMKKTNILVFQIYGRKIKPSIYWGNNKVELTDSYV